MIETFTALLFAHVMADFALQTNWINKNKGKAHVMALYGAIVWVTAHAALGQIYDPALAVLTAAHLAIDGTKTWGKFRSLTAFVTDQAAHVITLLAAAFYAPMLWQTGHWATCPTLLPLMSGLIYLMILANQPLGVGFLIAAKSILRFGTASRDQRTAEYVIIGTLASFGWAIAITIGIQLLLSALPPLEIIPKSP